MQTACIGFKCEDSGTEGPYDLPLWEDARSCPLSGKSQLQLLQKGSATGQSWVMRNTECASRRADWRKGKHILQQQLGERSKILWEKQPWNHHGQCRRKAVGAPGMEQKFPAAHGHHLEQISMNSLWRSTWWSKKSGGSATHERTHAGAVCSWRWGPVVRIDVAAVSKSENGLDWKGPSGSLEELQPVVNSLWICQWSTASHGRDLTKEHWKSEDEEWQWWSTRNWLHPYLPESLEGRK